VVILMLFISVYCKGLIANLVVNKNIINNVYNFSVKEAIAEWYFYPLFMLPNQIIMPMQKKYYLKAK